MDKIKKAREIASDRDSTKYNLVETIILLSIYILVNPVFLSLPLKVEWIWRAPQLIIPLIILLFRRIPVKEIGMTGKDISKNISYGIVIGIILTSILLPVYLWLLQPNIPKLLFPSALIWMGLFVTTNVFVIEFFYRGLLQNRISKLTSPTYGIVGVSLLASMDFFELTIFDPITVALSALVFGYLYEETDSLVTPLTAHITWFMATTLILAYL